uniref:Uncharacterized protein n=1 Tax=Meloidogyne enterolobii TaxID=390850 RepID=A0A6V7VF56_MELEN|nr:unnamed protein product [Meloidogyne enterolobii]
MSTNRIEQQNRLTIYLNSKTQKESEEESLQQPTNGQELKSTYFGRAKLFFRKYFLQGQLYSNEVCSDDDEEEVLEDVFNRYRKYIGFLLPCLFMQIMWWTLAFRYNFFRLFPTHYELPLTMVVGATVAGMTSEGGGAVAFPVMTLLLHIETEIARDFSLMVQSCGMTSAAFTILWMRIKLEWHAIILCTIGSTAGIIFGLEWLKNFEFFRLFVSIWFSFAISLYVLNTQKKRRTHSGIVKFNWWKALILFVAGFIGGLCSAFAGSGVDICAFSVLTLLFRLSEKVATPTSVVLMAANTCVGFFWRHLIMSEVSTLAWNYFTCSVPVVVLFAPLGSLLASHFHRLVLASFVYVLEGLALLGFLATGPEWRLIGIGSVIIFCSFFFFLAVSRIGYWLDETERKTTTKLNGKNCGQIKSKESKTIRFVIPEK